MEATFEPIDVQALKAYFFGDVSLPAEESEAQAQIPCEVG